MVAQHTGLAVGKCIRYRFVAFSESNSNHLRSNYPTLPISHVVYCSLKWHLNNKSQLKEEETLKQILLEKLEYHFNTKLSQKQLNITLVKFTFYLLFILKKTLNSLV